MEADLHLTNVFGDDKATINFRRTDSRSARACLPEPHRLWLQPTANFWIRVFIVSAT